MKVASSDGLSPIMVTTLSCGINHKYCCMPLRFGGCLLYSIIVIIDNIQTLILINIHIIHIFLNVCIYITYTVFILYILFHIIHIY